MVAASSDQHESGVGGDRRGCPAVASCRHPRSVSPPDGWQSATCGTFMHLQHNVPVAIISAWLGHADTAFTMCTYVHNQPEKLALAAESI
jgi:hypothetical protein